jgi:hypothetical protein
MEEKGQDESMDIKVELSSVFKIKGGFENNGKVPSPVILDRLAYIKSPIICRV